MEEQIVKYLKELDPDTEIILNSRKIIPPMELDIYLPEYKLAIEVDGLMFHSRGISQHSIFNKPYFPKNKHLEKLVDSIDTGNRQAVIFLNKRLKKTGLFEILNNYTDNLFKYNFRFLSVGINN